MNRPGLQDVIENNFQRPRLEQVGEALANRGQEPERQGPECGFNTSAMLQALSLIGSLRVSRL